MNSPPADVFSSFAEALERKGIVGVEQGEYLKWLRFYWDFCSKYRHPPREEDSLEPFLQKLASKGQSPGKQAAAAKAVGMCQAILRAKVVEGPVSGGGKEAGWAELSRRLKEEIRIRQYSDSTLKTYRNWILQFGAYLDHKNPEALDSEDARKYLTHLAVDQNVAASTQNQAFNALLFLYRHILKAPYELGDTVIRAKRTKYIPVVLTREEIDRIVNALDYPFNLLVQLLYGCGLRLFEGLNLRVHCVNLDERILTVHDGKGRKDRTVPLPERIVPELQQHLLRVEKLHSRDLAEDYNGVFMPKAYDRKASGAARELIWQWVFPAKTLTLVPGTGERRRYHLHDRQVQVAVKAASQKAKMHKRVTCHLFRHSFASHQLWPGGSPTGLRKRPGLVFRDSETLPGLGFRRVKLASNGLDRL